MPRTIQPDTTIEKKKVGRPSTYDDSYALLAERIVKETGVSKAGLGRVMGVNPQTILDWCVANSAFAHAIKQGTDFFNTHKAEKSLLQCAMGFEYDEVTVEDIQLKQGKGDQAYYIPAQKRKVVHRRMAPNVAALVFLLCNRDAERWKNVQRQFVEGKVEHKHLHSVVMDLAKLGTERLEQLQEIALEAELKGKPITLLEGGKLRIGQEEKKSA